MESPRRWRVGGRAGEARASEAGPGEVVVAVGNTWFSLVLGFARCAAPFLGPVEVHLELMMAAVRWIIAVKLVSVLQALTAMRSNSLILHKKFSIR